MEISRRYILNSLVALPFIGSNAFAKNSNSANSHFAAISQSWINGTMRLNPVWATQIGDHRFDGVIDDLSANGRAQNLAFNQDILRRLNGINKASLSRANLVDFLMLENQVKSSIWSLEVSQEWAWNPLYYQNTIGSAIYNLMAREFAPINVRLENAIRRMLLTPNALAQSRAEIVKSRVSEPFAQTYLAQNEGIKSVITEMIDPVKSSLAPERREALDRAITIYNSAIDSHSRWIEKELIPQAQADFRAGAQAFDEKLKFTLQSDLSRQEIRARAEQEIINVRARMYEIARGVLQNRADAPPLPINPNPQEQQNAIKAALDLAASDRPSRNNLVETARQSTEIARHFVMEKDLISLPQGPVKVILMPEFQRGFSVAYCDSPGPLDKNLDTFYAVSPIPDDWNETQATSFLREYNMRGIQDIAVHEAMPGHYVQIFHANSYPSVLRAILGSGSFIEGWAVYAENMMVEEGFKADDPLYALTQLKVLLRTISNSIIDQAIHVDGMTREEMMKFLTETTFQEEREAAGKWRRAQLSTTQLSTYFVGFLGHMAARDAAKTKLGTNFNLKSYHDGILSFGSPPAKLAQALLLNEEII